MPFDEEELDPHGECAAEIKRLRFALKQITDLEPFCDKDTCGGSMLLIAKTALKD